MMWWRKDFPFSQDRNSIFVQKRGREQHRVLSATNSKATRSRFRVRLPQATDTEDGGVRTMEVNGQLLHPAKKARANFISLQLEGPGTAVGTSTNWKIPRLWIFLTET
jgi:hypothetical protein